jgi:hypothetical protein
MTLTEIYNRVDEELNTMWGHHHAGDKREDVRAFLHAQIKQAILDVLPEYVAEDIDSPLVFGYDIGFAECKRQIIKSLQ